MLLVLSKFLPLCVYPVGLTLICGIVAVVLLWRGRSRAGLWCVVAALGLLYVSSLPVTAHVLVRSLEKRYLPLDAYPQCDAIVVLGGSGVAALPPRKYPETNQSGDRIMHAARLYMQGYADTIITSGGKIAFLHTIPGSEAQINADLLIELFGIDSTHILRETEAKNTHDHGRLIKEVCRRHGLGMRILLVTSAMHMHRAVQVMERAGFEVYPAPTDFREDACFQYRLIKWLPRAGALQKVYSALHEYYGLWAYRALGWI